MPILPLNSRPTHVFPAHQENTNNCVKSAVRWLKATGNCQCLRKIFGYSHCYITYFYCHRHSCRYLSS